MGVEERRLQIPAVLEQIVAACNFVVEVAQDAGLDDDGVYHCQLSVEEICTNIIEHGYESGDESKVIDIVCQRHSDRFVITIVDDAPQFNPLELSDPDPSVPLWERKKGGWGVYFVKKFMNDVRYHYESNRNHLTLQKRIN